MGRVYKKQLAALPTLEHVGDGLGAPDFVISSWRINDAKYDLTADEFVLTCRSVLLHHRYGVTRNRTSDELARAGVTDRPFSCSLQCRRAGAIRVLLG